MNLSGVIGGINECVTLWKWTKSAISSLHSQWSGSQEQDLQDHVLQLENGLQHMRDTLPAMHGLINGAEWRSHDDVVASLLQSLKDAVFDAEDLLDEFSWYEKKVQVEGTASQSPFIEFFDNVIEGSFNKLKDIRLRLSSLSSQMENMELRGVTRRFDRLVKQKTTSFTSEIQIFGRDKELKKVLELLNVPTNSKRKRATNSMNTSTSTSASNLVNSESSLPVWVIGGIGGVGKTTLAQLICSHQRVRSHFENIIWICVSYDFDVKRLTKEVAQSFTGLEATTDGSLQSLQGALKKHVNNKRLLIVLDDVWDDALKDNGQYWKRFCAPFSSVQEGSAMLVTTRCPNVTKGVCTMEHVVLAGLKGKVFWNFFKTCVFGSDGSNNDPELECIGRSILPKLKGSPLAAKTLGRMLSMDLQASHWNFILESGIWELKQKETDILPTLRRSYMHLPFYLKRCFAFCAVYPKNYKFQKACLAEIWVAEGFVEPQAGVPIQDTGCQYFEDLVARSFFQKVSGGYVIHDLLHDMAQKVSEHDCFILRNKSDFDKVPLNVRHLCILPSSDFDHSNLPSLCKYTKLRTLICKKSLGKKADIIMGCWCTKLLCVRVMSCASVNKLPDNIGNWKHLRYLEISTACPLKRIPSTFCLLYNMQILYAKKCKLEFLPRDFGKLISLQKFETHTLTLDSDNQVGPGMRLLKNLNTFRGYLEIANVGITKDHAAEAELKNMKYLEELKLNMHSSWGFSRNPDIIQNKDVFEVLQPPIGLKSLFLKDYGCSSLPRWFQPQCLPSLNSLAFIACVGLKSISSPMITQSRNLNGIFMSLTDLAIDRCQNMSSLEDFLLPDYVPAIKRIRIDNCKLLASVPTEKFGGFHLLEELHIWHCRNIRLQGLVSQSLKKLSLSDSGFFCNMNCCSLTDFDLTYGFVTSIQLQKWILPALQSLEIWCESLVSIRDSGSRRAFSSLNFIKIYACHKLPSLVDLLTPEYLPAIEKIEIGTCRELKSLPIERFGSFPCLKHLVVYHCPSLKWKRSLVLPTYLQSLCLKECGDISSCIPRCLQNLTSLVSFEIGGCNGITSIPGNIWRTNLVSLEKLVIENCLDLVSIGGAEAVANINDVEIWGCSNMEEEEQINRISRPRRTRRTR